MPPCCEEIGNVVVKEAALEVEVSEEGRMQLEENQSQQREEIIATHTCQTQIHRT